MLYIHAGNDRLIRTKNIIGIFDMDTATQSAVTKKFLNESQKEGRIILTTYELPRSFILTEDDMVTLSQLSVNAISGRIKNGDMWKLLHYSLFTLHSTLIDFDFRKYVTVRWRMRSYSPSGELLLSVNWRGFGFALYKARKGGTFGRGAKSAAKAPFGTGERSGAYSFPLSRNPTPILKLPTISQPKLAQFTISPLIKRSRFISAKLIRHRIAGEVFMKSEVIFRGMMQKITVSFERTTQSKNIPI